MNRTNSFGKCYQRIFNKDKGKGYLYYEIDSDMGLPPKRLEVTDPAILKQLSKIKVPPTYSNVILCPDPRNDLVGQAVDGKGKLQYFYSEKYQAQASHEKNCNLLYFGDKITEIMTDVAEILDAVDTDADSVDEKLALHALALRIMTLCHFRPGSSQNIRKNGTYGLTTIGPEHLELNSAGTLARITFVGKKSQINSCVIQDQVAVDFLEALNKHRSKLTKKYSRVKLLDPPGNGPSVTPGSLNDFLQTYHPSITTKTWRTWFANISYIENLLKMGIIPQTIRDRKILSNRVVRTIAEELHHTMAVNKRNYLIPELEALFVRDPEHWISMSATYPDAKNFLMAFLNGYCAI